MQLDKPESSAQTLQDIRSIMERSSRFLSLSGWSGIWAGGSALAGAAIAQYMICNLDPSASYINQLPSTDTAYYFNRLTGPFLTLAVVVFLVALCGGYLFTRAKAIRDGQKLWNRASRQLITNLAIPLVTGAIFILGFVQKGDANYIAPACLVFYGLALINGSKYTVSDIRYLGILEIGLGIICLFSPKYSLYIWAFGFGVLHILYGAIMWNKYDKQKG
jgi:hypothetical protein